MSFKLDLTSWEADVPEIIEKIDPSTQKKVKVYSGKTVKDDYPVRENLSAMLRSPGVFRDANEVAEAVFLAHAIRDHESDSMELDSPQIAILKKCVDTHLAAAADQRGNFGGPNHEPLILQIVKLAKDANVR
jgi:hypothetical protein